MQFSYFLSTSFVDFCRSGKEEEISTACASPAETKEDVFSLPSLDQREGKGGQGQEILSSIS